MNYGMVVNYKYCTNCHSCEVSCQKEKGLPEGEWGIKVQTMGPAEFERGWEWDYLPVPSSNCDMCEGRIERGEKPLCALHCLASVIEVLPVEEIPAAMVKPEGKTVVFLRNGEE